jgi:hypothetical protein
VADPSKGTRIRLSDGRGGSRTPPGAETGIPGISSTGTGAARATRSATLPKAQRANPLRQANGSFNADAKLSQSLGLLFQICGCGLSRLSVRRLSFKPEPGRDINGLEENDQRLQGRLTRALTPCQERRYVQRLLGEFRAIEWNKDAEEHSDLTFYLSSRPSKMPITGWECLFHSAGILLALWKFFIHHQRGRTTRRGTSAR